MTRHSAAAVEQGSVARLVAAEREWQVALERARADAEAYVTAAATLAAKAELAAEADLHALIDARSAELAAERCAAVGAVLAEVEQRAARYRDAPDAVVDALAARVADCAPWFAPVEAPP